MARRQDEEEMFWRMAAEEIRDGEEVTVMRGGHVIVCSTLAELYQARADFEREAEACNPKEPK